MSLLVGFAEVAIVANRRCTPRAPFGEFAVDGTSLEGHRATPGVCEDREDHHDDGNEDNAQAHGEFLAGELHRVMVPKEC